MRLRRRRAHYTHVVSMHFTDSLASLWERLFEDTPDPRRRDLRVRRTVRRLRRRDPHTLRILFVCVGNACRSQMAEAFAKAYGGPCLHAESAGLEPAQHIPQRTRIVMAERGIALARHYPKPMYTFHPSAFDLIVNLCRRGLPIQSVPVLRFPVDDPGGEPVEFHREIRNTIEHLVETILVELPAASPGDRCPAGQFILSQLRRQERAAGCS